MSRRAVRVALMLALGSGLAAVAQVPGGPMPPRPSLGGPDGIPPPGMGVAPVSVGTAAESGAPQTASSTNRDPFWPVGYMPRRVVKPSSGLSAPGSSVSTAPAEVALARPPDWDEARRRLEIKGVSRIGRDKASGREIYFADVNGRVVEDGGVVSVVWDGRVYRWRVTQVAPSGLQLVKLDCHAE